MTTEFADLMKSQFEMGMVGELTYFLGLQVKQQPEGIFISQSTYALNLIKRFGFENGKTFKTPM
ncbi:reverse transcriptase domain-containing protein, partial [Mycobacterium kansasii]